jgi:hypothetical protein
MDWQEALGNVFANTRKVFGVTPYRTTGVWDMPENLPQETPAAVSPVAPVGGLSYDPSTGVVSGSPIKKEVPGLSDLVNKFSGSFSNFKSSPISSSPVLSDEMKANIQKQTGPVTGLGDDYWKGISDQATKRLHEQYFDRGGLYDQAQENYASRGLVGSGVEQQLLSDQVYKPYSQEVSDVVSQIASEQTKYGVDIEKFNRELGLKGTEMLTNLAIADKQMGQQAEIANKNIEY